MTEWETVRLGDVLPFKYGKNLPAGKRSRSGEYRVVSSAGFIDTHGESLTQGPAVVIGRKGSVGSVFYSKEPVFPIDTTFFVEGNEQVDLRFGYYLLCSLGLDSMGGDSAVPGLNREYAESVEFAMPPVRMQQEIAEILGSIDDLIENNRRRIEILEEMARSIYREWFVHFRYPGHENVPLVDSELGPIPKGWETAPYSSVASFVNGYAFKPDDWSDSGRPIVKIKELKQGVTSATPRHDEANIDTKYWIEDGDLLFSWSADLDVYLWNQGAGLLNQHLFVVRPLQDQLNSAFLFHSLKADMPQFRMRAQGATMRHIKRAALGEVDVLLPDPALMLKFAEAVSPLHDDVLELSKQSRVLVEFRDKLLPRLVTGKIDVSELDLDALLDDPAKTTEELQVT